MGFVKRFVLSMVASKLQRMSHGRHNPAVDGLLREVNHRIARQQGYGHHPGAYGHHGGYGHHGHYRQHGHYRHHGHYRRRRWF
ncbi:hypothetical protein QLQ12_00830 [Actinoplanes sp. NEAU-A12]|uniref:Uncharacterized protein n=1 Tax=Actinoplanes sandaracinus TaxID=3045177 RepID=A0ABT6WBN9_9ACTN|nr:hypothetical protein [Actinoplanes sandaracinus]MDI6097152.1 hypothetical protein [Actinoplanes sandaracinus]